MCVFVYVQYVFFRWWSEPEEKAGGHVPAWFLSDVSEGIVRNSQLLERFYHSYIYIVSNEDAVHPGGRSVYRASALAQRFGVYVIHLNMVAPYDATAANV